MDMTKAQCEIKVRSSVFVAVFLLTLTSGATEYFVDRSRPNDDGAGTSVETAKRTIQAAVEAAGNNDTITVLPGVYDEGETADKDGALNRVFVNDKKLTIRSRDGRAVTHIVGRKDPNPEDPDQLGLGPNAVRGICLQGDSQPVVTIEGFTIRDGASQYANAGDEAKTRGGGIHGYYAGFYIVDCVISNCVAVYGGGSCRGRAVRTLVTENVATKGGAAVRDTHMFWSIITRNGGSVISYYTSVGGKVVNSTYVENGKFNLFTGNSANMPIVSNSLIVQNSGPNNDNTKAFNCVITDNIKFNEETDCRDVAVNATNVFVATAYEDYRPLADSPAIGCASIDKLNDVPEAYRLTDFAGTAVDPSEPLNGGAIQASAARVGGTVYFRNANIESSGKRRLDTGMYANAIAWPTQYPARAVLESGSVYRVDGTGSDTQVRYPDRFGNFAVTAPALGVLSLSVAVADRVLWVTNGVPSASPTGARDDPFGTIQDAIDAAPTSGKTLVCVMPGVYDRGGAWANDHSNRVCIGSNKAIGLVSLEGAERTVICGAPDPTTADGFGEASVRCVSIDKYDAFVRGFTLTGGFASKGQSAGVWGNNRDTVVLDSVISNNTSTSNATAARNVTLLRCRVTDNSCASSYGVLTYCTLLSSLVYGNSCTAPGDKYLLRYTGHVYDSTIVGDGVMRVGSDIICRNSIFESLASVETTNVSGCLKRGISTVSAATGWTDAELMYVDAENGDYRLYSLSTGLDAGSCDASDVDYQKRSASDFAGRVACLRGGMPVPGALKTPISAVWVVCETKGIKGSGIFPEGTNIVACGTVFTATATRADRGNFVRFDVNGESRGTDPVINFAIPEDPVKDLINVTAVYRPLGLVLTVR